MAKFRKGQVVCCSNGPTFVKVIAGPKKERYLGRIWTKWKIVGFEDGPLWWAEDDGGLRALTARERGA